MCQCQISRWKKKPSCENMLISPNNEWDQLGLRPQDTAAHSMHQACPVYVEHTPICKTLKCHAVQHTLCQAFRTSGSSLQEVLVGWTDLKSYSIPCRASLWLETLEDVPVPDLPMEEETKLREHAKQP